MEYLLASILVIIMIAVLAALLTRIARKGFRGGHGISATAYLGASYEMLSEDQRRAAEIIVEDRAGAKREDDESGEPSPEHLPSNGISMDNRE